MKKRILFITGTANQTAQMHQISAYLADDYDCWFSRYYADAKLINWGIRRGWLEHTVLGDRFRDAAETYLKPYGARFDHSARRNRYDLIVTCSDLLVPRALRQTKTVWVQEGMVDPVTRLSKWVQALGLPRYFSVGTSLNGSSNLCDIYCAASEGYKDFFVRMGTDPTKLFVTGIPNYDNLKQFLTNDFPHRDYVMVATSDMRETLRPENRPAFIRQAVQIAKGRPLLFKLHPNEVRERAEAEIRAHAPAGTLVFQDGNTNEMIANCVELITQYSTVVYVGIALGKPVHSYFDLDTLRRQTPIQNGGTSAANIARICRDWIEAAVPREDFVKNYVYRPMPYGEAHFSS